MNFQPIIQRTRAYLCLDCGKCTGSCPLARVDPEYSPRRMVERVIFGEAEAVMADPRLWSCMTCGLCSDRCPSDVDFTRFIVEMRAEAFRAGERGIYAHNGILQEVMRIQTMNVHQDRTGWLSADAQDTVDAESLPDMQTSDESEYFYFVGCLPFFDVIFDDLEVKALDIARSAVRLLNRVGINPIVSTIISNSHSNKVSFSAHPPRPRILLRLSPTSPRGSTTTRPSHSIKLRLSASIHSSMLPPHSTSHSSKVSRQHLPLGQDLIPKKSYSHQLGRNL